ncbi:MAG: glucose-phosphate thymidylyltransferase [Deltaproteobacteria bacterium]|nr:glucose-1-phosphate thymidylyltransferase [Acidobacteriota bacterium]MBP2675819.1 glucose-phosphate thymidylyltransferase [Deltaproteobacteria bacterium]
MPEREVIGLVPAAGWARRLGPQPFSKELQPLGSEIAADGTSRSRPVCRFLLDAFRTAGIDQACVVIRPGKRDIPECLGDGSSFGMRLSYLIAEDPPTVLHTLDWARSFVREAVVAMGFPDIVFRPADAFARLLARRSAGNADAVLGVFPVSFPRKAGVVELGDDGRVLRAEEGWSSSGASWTWTMAVWSPAVTSLLGDIVARIGPGPHAPPEPSTTDIVRAAIDAGMRVEGEVFRDGEWIDIGTPEGLASALRRFGGDGTDITR